ncbi:polysaccharide deacetylase family protein [Catenulispora pinisilvae]|uniref:polysaccharide deacetylase family protein n=1 Tax=Catenulispora pinisilvae TaxID=2705253 RepID=UPI0018915D28|nr:polysaccharide deacetylase family protein [Catenulispora pinisilvae]
MTLLSGCASNGGGSAGAGPVRATTPAGATVPTGSEPSSRPTTGGAPFPGHGTAGSGSSTGSAGSVSSSPVGSSSGSSNGGAAGSPTTAPAANRNDAPPAPGHPQFYVHEGDKAIALTIDDGPSSKYTPQVLALLAQYKIAATFCMIGQNAAQHASLVAEVSAAGHLVANHTWDHADLSRMSEARVTAEIERANDAITKGGARQPVLFRAPGGNWSPTVFSVCAKMGLRPLDWSVDPRDWSRPGTDHIVQTVMGHTHTGSIILEHDGGGDRSQTVAALRRFIPQLLEAGYHFVQP